MQRTATNRAHRKLSSRALLAGLALVCTLAAWPARPSTRADNLVAFRVIVHPSNALATTTRDSLSQVFFKRSTRWQNGEPIRPVDLRPESAVREAFSQRVLQRSVAAVRSFWLQRVFSGRELPPPELDSDAAVIRYVGSNRGAIGYVSGSAKIDGTKELSVH